MENTKSKGIYIFFLSKFKIDDIKLQSTNNLLAVATQAHIISS